MAPKIVLLSLFIYLILGSCKSDQVSQTPKIPTADIKEVLIDFKSLSSQLIKRADLKSDEGVLLVLMPGQFNPIVPLLKDEILAKNANYLGALSVSDHQPVEWNTAFVKKVKGLGKEDLTQLLDEVDLGIMLPGANPEHLPYKVLQDILQEGPRRTIHFHWAGAYDLNGSLLANNPYIDSFYQSIVIDTKYETLAMKQSLFEESMRDNSVRVTTPKGTDISFNIDDRPVTKQDGNASAERATQGRNLIDREIEIPSGAIRVAPLEESVNGTIAFPNALWDNQAVEDLIVTITHGKITDIKASSGREAVLSEMGKAGDAGKSFREFALGFNELMPLQKTPFEWIPYYGYGAGIVRLSLGDNTELGGKVDGGYVRWNFFPDATVKVGEILWVKDGEMIYDFNK